MNNVYSDFIQFRGSHYEFGLLQGELLKKSLILANRKKQWGSKPHHFIIDEEEFQYVIKKFAPGILDELHGLSDTLKWPFKDAIREFGGYYLEYGQSGCSIITGPGYMIRNYDNHPHSYEGRYLLYQPTDRGYASIGPSMQITGRTDGLNEKGLAMGYNFTNRKQSKSGFLCNMIGRIILERCANAQEAVALLKEIPHRHSFSYVLIDKNGQSVVVEASPRSVVTRKENVCTNHFDRLINENRYRMEDSLRRAKLMRKYKKENITSIEAFRRMNDINYSIFSSNYKASAGTLHTASYYPNVLKAGFALGGNKAPLFLDFDKWLAGHDTNIKQIKGTIDSTSTFVNMMEL